MRTRWTPHAFPFRLRLKIGFGKPGHQSPEFDFEFEIVTHFELPATTAISITDATLL